MAAVCVGNPVFLFLYTHLWLSWVQRWDPGPLPLCTPGASCSAPPAGVLHPTWARGARPPLPQWDPALRLQRLRQNLRPCSEPGAAHARPLPGGQLAEHSTPTSHSCSVLPPGSLGGFGGSLSVPLKVTDRGALIICRPDLGLRHPPLTHLSP